MKFSSVLLLIWLMPAFGTTVPVGTRLQVRLTTEASSEKPSGAPISAVIVVPVFVDGALAIAPGTNVMGNTADARTFRPASDQVTEQPATLRLEFTRIEDKAGSSKPLVSVVEGVDNARESINSDGLITGIAQSETLEAQIDRGINKLASQYGQFAQLLSGVKGALVKEVDASIDYKAGVDLTIRLAKPLEWSSRVTVNLPGAITPAEALAALVNAEPSRTVAENPPKPSDVTNLMFIGSAEQLGSAFRQAGWFAADALSRSSKMETARALIEDRGYREAPMSLLSLDGRPPDLAMQKQNDTFAMRHHIRIWHRPETFNGKPVWVAAATHDTSIVFSPQSRSFTHGIDSNIDLERAKVVNDLLFTQRARGVALVERTALPQNLSNATGDKLITDGKMAVVEF
jgi:LssY C-terminus